jgi:hypothetical protein
LSPSSTFRYGGGAAAGQGSTVDLFIALNDRPPRPICRRFHRSSRVHRSAVRLLNTGMLPPPGSQPLPPFSPAFFAAGGNAGPKSPPLYPGADPNVIAVTATDVDDKLFTGANRGRYISVSAPGVDILVPAPEGDYQITTGTSVAAAEVSGIVALLLERNPS